MNFWEKFKLYLGFYWILWVFIFSSVFIVNKIEVVNMNNKIEKLRSVLDGTTSVKNINNTRAFLSSASKDEIKSYFQNYSLETVNGIKKIFNSLYPQQSETLRNRFNDILRPYFEKMMSGSFTLNDKKELLDSLIDIFTEAQETQNRILINYKSYFIKLALLVILYQLIASYFYANATKNITIEILEGFFNATDLSIISTISILFFKADLILSYSIVFFGFFWHMLLLGATIASLKKELIPKSVSKEVISLIGGYFVSFTILIITAYFSINKIEFLLCTLASVIVSFIFGYYLYFLSTKAISLASYSSLPSQL